jgi:hypothetical protein
MTTFATPLELSQYLTGAPATVGELDADFVRQATIFLQCIADDIEAVAGIEFSGGEGTDLVPGTWSRDLLLPRRPIIEITDVTLNGTALSTAAYLWNSRSLLRAGGDSLDDFDELGFSGDWYEHGMQGATWRAGGHWGGPASTVAVTYSWGATPLPGFLKSMSLRTAARVISNPGGLTQESLAVYSASYGSTGTDDGSHLREFDRKMLRRKFATTAGTISTAGL